MDITFHSLQIILGIFSAIWRYTHRHTHIHTANPLIIFSPFSLIGVESVLFKLFFPDRQFCYWLYFFCYMPLFVLHSRRHHYNHLSYIFSLYTDKYSIFYLVLPVFLTKVIYHSNRWLLYRSIPFMSKEIDFKINNLVKTSRIERRVRW